MISVALEENHILPPVQDHRIGAMSEMVARESDAILVNGRWITTGKNVDAWISFNVCLRCCFQEDFPI